MTLIRGPLKSVPIDPDQSQGCRDLIPILELLAAGTNGDVNSLGYSGTDTVKDRLDYSNDIDIPLEK